MARPLNGLSLFANVAYLDSNFLDYPKCARPSGLRTVNAVCTAAGLRATQDLRGKPAPNSPKWSGRLGFDGTGDLARADGSGTQRRTYASSRSNMRVSSPTITRRRLSRPMPSWARASRSVGRAIDGLLRFRQQPAREQYGLANLYQPLDSSLLLRNGIFPGSTAVRRQHADPRTIGASLTFRY